MKVKSIAGVSRLPGVRHLPQSGAPKEENVDAIVEAVKAAGARAADASEANTKALYALMLVLSKAKPATTAPAMPITATKHPKRWEFTFERDEDGFTEKIIAEAKYE